jgi:Aminoglycoside-2''-adenylyltransferase
MTDEELPPGGEPIGDDPPWDAWHPRDIAARLANVGTPWGVAAGWALDLFRGETTRDHEDLEIAVPIGRFDEIRLALPELAFEVVGSGHRWPLDASAFTTMVQTWGRESATGIYRVDVFREPHDGDMWLCRRDEDIRRPYGAVIALTPDGIPYLVPEIVLLFKAKHDRPKDHEDFEGVLPLLNDERRAWLAAGLERVHPGHVWLERL